MMWFFKVAMIPLALLVCLLIWALWGVSLATAILCLALVVLVFVYAFEGPRGFRRKPTRPEP